MVEGLPFKDKEFDQVLAPEILEHVDFDQAVAALRECARVGKRVLITIPNGDKPDYDPALVHNIEHRWLVNRQSVDRLLREAGCMDYELDTSEALDFYLLDIRTETKTPRVRIHERAALLPTLNVDPGEPLQVAVDVSALEDDSSRNRGIGRYMLNHFRELIRQRPDVALQLCGCRRRHRWCRISRNWPRRRTACTVPWTQFARGAADVLYLPHPLGPMCGMELMKAVGELAAVHGVHVS